MNNHFQDHFSILGYYTDSSMYTNKHKCNDFTPPFISYIPIGVKPRNIGLESDLKGITRTNSHCYKYVPKNINLATQLNNHKIKSSKNKCKMNFTILQNGYIDRM